MPSIQSYRSVALLPGRNLIGPLFLCTACPPFVILLYHILIHQQGSFLVYLHHLLDHNPIYTVYSIWPNWRNVFVWQIIVGFIILQFIIIKLFPGQPYAGPITPHGHMPIYSTNGFPVFSFTMLLYNIGVILGFYNGGVLFDYIGEILSSMNVSALLLCLFLYIKGLYLPSSSDHGSTDNAIFDFYWGTELHPRIFGVQLKQLIISRVGMSAWALLVVSCVYKQLEMQGHISNGMLVNSALQLIYIGKFFWWETGYYTTFDIIHDRLGFYLCWGVLVFMQCVHTSHSLYLAQYPDSLPFILATIYFLIGLLAIWMEYDCDKQKQLFRANPSQYKIWGKPAEFIEAKYKTEKGEMKKSLLLTSGWWGLARHFNYFLELLITICITLPVHTNLFMPYFYLPYMTILILDRLYRDDARCQRKYGVYWKEYCKKVPYKLLPDLF